MFTMVKYEFRIDSPNQQYIQITAHFATNDPQTILHIPSWRPGRYELGNFAKNVKKLVVYDDTNKRIEAQKINKDTWQIDTQLTASIRVEYSYYAAELNAGSTFLSNQQLYVNPVNCCVFTDETMHLPTQLSLFIPQHWEIAGAMHQENNMLHADNFDHLADSPFICSPSLQHDTYTVNETTFHLWFNGEVKPDWPRLKFDFHAFTSKQIEKYSEFPVENYHFLFQILPIKAYHGVEHSASTVIAFGPSYEVFKQLYSELLGVSSHELYHTWNVKAIRPIELFPYNFTTENYSQLGYISEGITTYMGDLFLLKSGVFTLENYLHEFNKQLQKHFDNPARFNYSVADSSFDTWLDGYAPGAPGRKVSIYTEGCLLAFVTDVLLLKATNNAYGLDAVMKHLYFNVALKGKGISEKEYQDTLENIGGISFQHLFDEYIHGTKPYESILIDALDALGLELKHQPAASYAAKKLGIKTMHNGNHLAITAIYHGSPAELAGLCLNDEIIAVNAMQCRGDLDKWLEYFDDDTKKLTIIRMGQLLEVTLPEVNRYFFLEYHVVPVEQPISSQQKRLEAWKR